MEPLIDGSSGQNFPVLELEEYKAGDGGTSDGHTAVVFILYDVHAGLCDSWAKMKAMPWWFTRQDKPEYLKK